MGWKQDSQGSWLDLILQENLDACAIACARMVIKRRTGRTPTEGELRARSQAFEGGYHRDPKLLPGAVPTPLARMGIPPSRSPGTELTAVQRLIGLYGIASETVDLQSPRAVISRCGRRLAITRPAIAGVEAVGKRFGHAVVLSKFYATDWPGRLIICDPQFGLKEYHWRDADMPHYQSGRDMVRGADTDMRLRMTGYLLQTR